MIWIMVGMTLIFILVISVHELGHYLAARMVGVRSTVFSLGFGKVLASHVDARGTKWQIAALPFGGYCRFVGDENAASLASQSKALALPGSLATASLWSRAFVVIAGPLANIVLAVALFFLAGLLSQTPVRPLTVATVQNDQTGLQAGDVIQSIESLPIEDHPAFINAALAPTTKPTKLYEVERNGSNLTVSAPGFFVPVIASVIQGSASDLASVRPGDVIKAINGKPIATWAQLQSALAAPLSSPLKRLITLVIERADQTVALEFPVVAQNGSYRLGVTHQPPFTLQQAPLSSGAALRRSVTQMTGFVALSSTGIVKTLLGQGELCKLSGPVGIAKLSGQALQLGGELFFQFAAVISASLALMNLLPIPGLDGGHLMSYTVEGATGREMSPLWKKITFILGITMISYLIIIALVADFIC